MMNVCFVVSVFDFVVVAWHVVFVMALVFVVA